MKENFYIVIETMHYSDRGISDNVIRLNYSPCINGVISMILFLDPWTASREVKDARSHHDRYC